MSVAVRWLCGFHIDHFRWIREECFVPCKVLLAVGVLDVQPQHVIPVHRSSGGNPANPLNAFH
jgi:hypothetical protein